jgi:hypothetical protein
VQYNRMIIETGPSAHHSPVGMFQLTCYLGIAAANVPIGDHAALLAAASEAGQPTVDLPTAHASNRPGGTARFLGTSERPDHASPIGQPPANPRRRCCRSYGQARPRAARSQGGSASPGRVHLSGLTADAARKLGLGLRGVVGLPTNHRAGQGAGDPVHGLDTGDY